MAKKRPFIAIIVMILVFALVAFIALLPNGITGFTVYEEFSSMFSQNALATVGPTAIFIIIFAVAIIALKRISKES